MKRIVLTYLLLAAAAAPAIPAGAAPPATPGYQTIVSGLYLTSNMCDPNGKVGAYMSAFAQPLPAGALTFDRTLSTVRLAGRVVFSDEVTGGTLPLDVDVTWSAT